jgi:hypothetical protein
MAVGKCREDQQGAAIQVTLAINSPKVIAYVDNRLIFDPDVFVVKSKVFSDESGIGQ